jgi:hypothetical protein
MNISHIILIKHLCYDTVETCTKLLHDSGGDFELSARIIGERFDQENDITRFESARLRGYFWLHKILFINALNIHYKIRHNLKISYPILYAAKVGL